jgi:hypothetical protein
VLAGILGATGGALGLLIGLGVTDGTILGIVGSGVVAASAWLMERRMF